MDKKAIEIQFNWLFVLVAGAAILIFFTMVIVKQKDVSDLSSKASILKSIEAIISGASVSSDSTNIVKMPQYSIEIGCNRISIGGTSRQFQNLILFGPSAMKGNDLVTQTQGLNVPFRATNILHVANLVTRYIIITDSQLTKEINKSMPIDLKKEILPSYDLTPIRFINSKTRIIFSGPSSGFNIPASLQRLADEDLSALRIEGSVEKGSIEFYQKKGHNWISLGTSSYIGLQSLLGAAYTDSRENYECSMSNAFLRLNSVASVYAEKANQLTAEVSCSDIYSRMYSDLMALRSASSSFTGENVELISSLSVSLKDSNEQLKRLSCPMIY